MLVFLFCCYFRHNETTSLLCLALLSVDQKHWMVGECLAQLFGGKNQENISDFSVNVQIHIIVQILFRYISHWPISS